MPRQFGQKKKDNPNILSILIYSVPIPLYTASQINPGLARKMSKPKDKETDAVPERRVYTYTAGGEYKVTDNLREYILDVLKNQGPITREELSIHTGIPRTTLYDTLDKLILKNKVYKFTQHSKKRGRPKVYYEIAG